MTTTNYPDQGGSSSKYLAFEFYQLTGGQQPLTSFEIEDPNHEDAYGLVELTVENAVKLALQILRDTGNGKLLLCPRTHLAERIGEFVQNRGGRIVKITGPSTDTGRDDDDDWAAAVNVHGDPREIYNSRTEEWWTPVKVTVHESWEVAE